MFCTQNIKQTRNIVYDIVITLETKGLTKNSNLNTKREYISFYLEMYVDFAGRFSLA